MCISFWKRFFPLSAAEEYLARAETSMKEYRTLRQIQNLRQAIQYYQKAYRLSNEKHAYCTTIITNYAVALNLHDQVSFSIRHRFQIFDLLKEARRIMEQTGRKPSSLYAIVLTSLAQCYLDQYRDTKAKMDYIDAVNIFRLAYKLPTSEIDPRPYLPALIGLASALWTGCEFHHSKDEVPDLRESIEYLHEAFERCGQHSDMQAECLRNLGSAYNFLFQKTRNMNDLDNSVEYNEKAVKSLGSSDPNLAATTFDLARLYHARYIAKRRSTDLGRAGECNGKARRLVESGFGNGELLERIEDLQRVISQQSRSFGDITAEDRSKREMSSLSYVVHRPPRHRRSVTWASSVGEVDEEDRQQAPIGSRRLLPRVHYRRSSREFDEPRTYCNIC